MSDHEHYQNKKSISKIHTILDEKYKIIKKIAKGSTCSIKLVQNLQTGQFLIMKNLSPKTKNFSSSYRLLKREIEFHSKTKHENIVRLLDHNLEGRKLKGSTAKKCHYIILDYAMRGDFFEYISINRGLNHKAARIYMRQLLNALEVLHSSNICHRDIKVDNILLDENYRLKLSDFEFCHYIRDQSGEYNAHTDKLGTIFYMAPEFFQLRKRGMEWKIYHHGDKIDVFACGVVLFIMLSGNYPFHSAEKYDPDFKCFYNEMDREAFWKKKGNSNIPDSARDLINKMLEPNPEKRITIKEIKEHAFFNEDVFSEIELFNYMSNISASLESSKKSM
jgi:serine/threonine protein kinase